MTNTNEPTTTNDHNDPIPSWYDEIRERITGYLAEIATSVQEVAQLYVQAIDRDPKFHDHLIDGMPEVPATFWRNLERVGRNQLDSRILGGSIPYGHKLRSLPVSEQRSAIDGSLTLLVRDGDSLAVKLDSITMEQAEQIFARDHIRSLPEQRAWLESRATKKRLTSNTSAPAVELDRKRKEIVIGHVRITAAEMLDYLRRLEG